MTKWYNIFYALRLFECKMNLIYISEVHINEMNWYQSKNSKLCNVYVYVILKARNEHMKLISLLNWLN